MSCVRVRGQGISFPLLNLIYYGSFVSKNNCVATFFYLPCPSFLCFLVYQMKVPPERQVSLEDRGNSNNERAMPGTVTDCEYTASDLRFALHSQKGSVNQALLFTILQMEKLSPDQMMESRFELGLADSIVNATQTGKNQTLNLHICAQDTY